MSQRFPRRHILQKSILALAGLSMAGNCFAADRSWINLAGGTFTTVANWQNGLFAGVNDAACFSNSSVFSPPGQATYTVNFSASAQNQAVKVRNDFVTFNLLGRTYTTTQITGNAIGTVAGGGTILVANSARLTIQNGTFNVTGALTPQMLVGAVPGGNGSLTIGNAGVLTGAPNLFVGTASAFGTLTINGGTATTSTLSFGSGANGRGNGVMNGPFAAMTSSRLFVGDAGAGTLSMTIAATLQNNGTAIIGNAVGASGFVNLDSSARWNQPGSLTIGAAGAGTVNVVNSAQLVGSSAVMASGTTSTATVRVGGPGSGSQWTNSGTFTIAELGQATLSVDGGGFVSAGTTIIGRSPGSAGTLNVTGAGSSVSFGRFFVGNTGTATVNVTDGGVLNAGTTVLSSNDGGTCTFNIAGVNSAAIFPRLSVADTDAASVNLTDGGRLTVNGDTDIGFTFDNPTASGRVNVSGAGTRWINAGKITLFSGQGNFINITGGGTVECNSADIRGGTGLIVDGVGSRWLNTGSLLLGTDMTITNGGVVDNTNATAPTQVSFASFSRVQGAGSAWNVAGTLEVGGFDSFLFIASGGHVQAANTLIKTDGTISLSSSGSDLTTGDLTLGFGTNSGSENLFVQFGASLHTQSAKLAGHNSTVNLVSAVTIRDAGSKWQNTGSVIIGGDGAANFPGHAKMDVLNSGSVTNSDAFIAFSPGSNGTVTVGGIQGFFPATWTTNGNLYVGGSAIADGGHGELRINTGGLVVVTDTLTLRDAGVIDLNGGTLTVGSLLGDLALIFQSGTLNITTQSPQIGDGNPLDGIILGTNRTVNVTNATTIRPDGRLRMLGGRYLSAGGITNNGEIAVDSGSRAIFENSIINNGSINVAANATIEFASNLAGPGNFIGPGAKIFRTGSNAVVSAIDTGAITIVNSGATLTSNRIREASLTILSGGVVNLNPGGTAADTSRLESLSMSTVARLDLADHALVIDYSAASPSALVDTLLTSGFAAGSWNGNGINSSVAASQSNRALGSAEATDLFSSFPASFAGETVDSTAVLVRFTLPGDSNLDQIVNISDFAIVAANFNTPTRWSKGDFNYDGVTNISDFALLAANFNQTLPADLPRQSVPEPGVAGIIALISCSLRRIRRA